MEPSDRQRAVDAAMSTASSLGLPVDDAVVLHSLGSPVDDAVALQTSTKLALRLVPCDVLARVSHAVDEIAVTQAWTFRLDLAQRLADTGSPVAVLESRVQPRVYNRAGFAITFWAYYEGGTLWRSYSDGTATPVGTPGAGYADALVQLHAGMRTLAVATPYFMEWVAGDQQRVGRPDLTPVLADSDRELISHTLARLSRSIADRGAREQLLHGEPHPDNVLDTTEGLLFIDWDTPCRGPVEYDLAWVPDEVAALYPEADEELLHDCRGLVLARLAAIRCDRNDLLPDGGKQLRLALRALRQGPPWPTLDALYRRASGAT